jgi:hypothetical protein
MTTRVFKTLLPVAALALGAFACSSSSSNTTQPPGDTAPVDSFINSLAQASCSWEFHCCTDPEIKTRDGNKYTDMAHCVPYSTLALQDQLYIERLAVRENRLTVDSASATACLAQATGKACNPAPGMAPPPVNPMQTDPCSKVFVGATPVGSECIYEHECVSGAHCVADQLATGRGVCVPYQESSQICNGSADCDPTVTQLYCAQQDFTCHVRAKLGEACAYTTDTTGTNPALPMLLECDTSVANLYCDPMSKTCKQLPGDGQPCLSPLPPGVATACDPDPSLQLVCSTQGTTQPGGTCRAPGRAGSDCSTVACDKGLYCASTGTMMVCTALPTLGQSCLQSGEQCAMPYFCNSAKNYVCDQPATLGQSCDLVSCDTGLYCDRTLSPNTCKAQLPDGSQCTQAQQCLSDVCGGTTFPETCQHQVTGIMCTGR